jgi:phosphoribosylanthranilate isomerase
VSARRSKVPLILSGGLSAENVGEAIARDAAVRRRQRERHRARPGHKDPERLRAFFEARAGGRRGDGRQPA